jgi:hypothetical protein
MNREQSWQVDGATLLLLRQIESLGYTVSLHRIPSSLLGRVGAFVEMHAVDLRASPPVQRMARVGVDEVGDAEYGCARLLAEAVGVHLESG